MVLKKQYFDANFPKDSDNATYHVGTKRGEVAARIVCVGDPTRAKVLASSPDFKLVFQKTSKRGFTTYTGYYKGTPISVVATGMGFPMADFFVRECRAVVDGPMLIVRYVASQAAVFSAAPEAAADLDLDHAEAYQTERGWDTWRLRPNASMSFETWITSPP
ncbi:hypothetical protein SeMB42_g06384 [Synchytrium endobioticum]|uniref:Nucleoside phosphorylase domain-containing protein n=1 Tax=Synchytrium endobioticum TaxID=286115 RepID=A0A507CE17_9FUNG|nr:hypothetical protein SeMB42_g06384 [Synchytrium endobioticum]